MTRKLSRLIDQAKLPETYLGDQEVKELIRSGKKVDIPKAKSYRPDRIRRFFKSLILIVMTSLITVFTLILILSPAKDIPVTKAPIDHAGKAAPTVVSADSLQVRDTSPKIIPQNSVKVKPKIKTEVPKKEESPKMGATRKYMTTDQADSIANSKIDWALETRKLGIVPIELDSTTLSCIGFDVRRGGFEILWQCPDGFDRSIRYIASSGKYDIMYVNQGYKRQTPAEYAKSRLKPVKFVALSVYGEAKPITQQHFYGSQFDAASFDKLLNISIPISIKGWDPTTKFDFPRKFKKPIFWIVPTEELINCLPDSIAEPMRKEFQRNIIPILQDLNEKDGKPVVVDTNRYVIPPEELANPVPCQYFPSFCEGLPGLDNLTVYPIPTSDFLNIEVRLLQSKKITYRVFDISGRVVNDQLQVKDYKAPGQYTERIYLSDLNSGLYLLVLTDNEGARMTRRILKN